MKNPSERRVAPRHPRRVQARFWLPGKDTPTSGMTANLSTTGALLTAPKVYPRGTRLRLELNLAQEKLVVEAEVAHGHRIPVELRALGSSAMGIRFLDPEELLTPFLDRYGDRASDGESAGDEGTTPAAEEAPSRAPAPDSAPRVYAVRFAGVAEFLDCFHRDLANGGLFVRTHHPRELQQVVELRFHIPDGGTVLHGRGRVVHVVAPPADGQAGGMGLELIELARLLDQLQPEVERLEAS